MSTRINTDRFSDRRRGAMNHTKGAAHSRRIRSTARGQTMGVVVDGEMGEEKKLKGAQAEAGERGRREQRCRIEGTTGWIFFVRRKRGWRFRKRERTTVTNGWLSETLRIGNRFEVSRKISVWSRSPDRDMAKSGEHPKPQSLTLCSPCGRCDRCHRERFRRPGGGVRGRRRAPRPARAY